jgi:hypothetical protein
MNNSHKYRHKSIFSWSYQAKKFFINDKIHFYAIFVIRSIVFEKFLSLNMTFTSTFMSKCSWICANVAFMSIILNEKKLIDWDEYTSISKFLNRYISTHTSFNDVHERASIINVYQFAFFERLKNSKLIINLLFILNRQFKSFDLWKNSM